MLGLPGLSDEADQPPLTDFDPAQYIPAGCDLLTLSATKVAQLLEKGIDPHVNRVVVRRVISGKHSELVGTFGASGSTIAGLASYGAGVYDVHGINSVGKYICAQRHRIATNGELAGLPPLGSSGPARGNGAPMPAPQDPMQALMFRLLEQRILQPAEDPMRGALAEMMKMMVVTNQQNAQMATQQQQFLMSQMAVAKQASEAAGAPAKELTDKLFALVLENMKHRPNGDGGGGAKAQIKDAMELVQFGVALAAAGGGRENPEDDPSWLKHILPIVDSMGPGVVATIAQAALPKEKADLVVETIKSHMQAREAEARAEVVTEGTEVPE